jgi:hypothetical protein
MRYWFLRFFTISLQMVPSSKVRARDESDRPPVLSARVFKAPSPSLPIR